jgi:hypothetical protein
MKIKTVFFAIIIITTCLHAFIGCNSTINEETDYAAFYIFNGTNRLKRKYITYESEYVFEYECEFELNNGEIRERGYNASFGTFNDWEDWLNYNFNNDVLEIKLIPEVNFYHVYKKI